MILNVGQQNPYQQKKYITLCRSCFCYVSVNECGRVWPQYFNMFVLCVKDEKQWPRWRWTKLCYLRAIWLFYWRRCHCTLSLILVWLITPHLWPQVWLGGLSGGCRQTLVPFICGLNTNSTIQVKQSKFFSGRCEVTHSQDVTRNRNHFATML